MAKTYIKKTFYYKFYVFLSLFIFGGALHFCVFAFAVSIDEFIPAHINFTSQFKIFSEIVFLIFEVIGAIITPILTKFFGLKKTLLFGFFLILSALVCATIIFVGAEHINVAGIFILLRNIFAGLSLTITQVAIISYIIFEMPRGIDGGILTFLAFTNIGGYLIFPFLFDICKNFSLQWLFISLFTFFIIFTIWLLNILVINPVFPKHIIHLRKGSMVWKELHYRLGLFLLAIFIISLGENAFTFLGWGKVFVVDYPLVAYSEKITYLFWIFVISSQLLLSFISIFMDLRKIFYFVIFMIILALFLASQRLSLSWLIASFSMGAVGCSSVFAIMTSELEKEIQYLTQKHHKLAYLFYIEFISAWMVGAYWLGDEVGFLHLRLLKNVFIFTSFEYFKVISFLIFITLFLIIFLFYTSSKIKKMDKKI